jgi:hypothetical protein
MCAAVGSTCTTAPPFARALGPTGMHGKGRSWLLECCDAVAKLMGSQLRIAG